MPDLVVRGVSTTFGTYFYKDGTTTPLTAVGGVQYTITTPDNALISSGIATQDIGDPAHWTVTVTIPSSAPVTGVDQRYQVKWRAASTNEIVTNNDYFQVADPAEADPVDSTTVTLVGTPFNLNLVMPDPDLSSLSVRILNPQGTPVVTLSNLISGSPSPPGPIEPSTSGRNSVYTIPINSSYGLDALVMRADGSGMTNYFAYFNYTSGAGQQLTEVQPIYLANTLVVSLMNDMRQFIDMLRNNDAVIELRITEAKLIHFAMQGLMRVNATSPANFTFDFISLARMHQFYFWVLKAAQYEILSALYLAEGNLAFDFQGMSVQLNIDRTQYINSMMNDIKTDLDNMLPKVKSQYARSGGFSGRVGTIGGVLGPASNWVFRANFGGPNFGGALPVLPFLF